MGVQKEWSVRCECGKEAELVMGDIIYPHRPDLHDRYFWICNDCNSYVGTHANSPVHKPLGRLADAKLRRWKSAVHRVFDPIWKESMKFGLNKSDARMQAYIWLSQQLNIPMKKCHIGYFDVDTCKRAYEVCKKRTEG